jgi:hypothetical protein
MKRDKNAKTVPVELNDFFNIPLNVKGFEMRLRSASITRSRALICFNLSFSFMLFVNEEIYKTHL